jgi:hypothetical protein
MRYEQFSGEFLDGDASVSKSQTGCALRCKGPVTNTIMQLTS